MNDPNSGQTAPEVPQAAIGGKRRFSLVWLIPIVAAIAGAWLVYTTFAERGPTITITLQTASGVEPGKTAIKYRDVQLGLVQRVTAQRRSAARRGHRAHGEGDRE